jgi:glycosyltransferase involved in cell wall biosynthesis
MKIVYIVPGTGGTFYCQNCVRDVDMVRALRNHGHDVVMVPVYLPILIDANGLSKDVPVFFGGVNVYLQQKFGVFRKTPRWLDKLFDSPWMLRRAAALEGSTESARLGPMTLSMLEGAMGNQKKELDRLLDWMVDHEKPDIVHLSNSLLLGMAAELKSRLRVPVVCTLQDEEAWLDGIDPPYDKSCWQAMSDRAEDVDAFVAVSEWYGREMRERMGVPEDKMHVVPVGIDLSDRGRASLSFDPPVIGYLSKMTESLGLGLLTDAFIQLKKNPKLSALKLRVTGGQLGEDIKYVAGLQEKLAKEGFDGDAEFMTEFDAAKRRDFLQSLSVLSVPAPGGESFGMFITEALAAGVPVVQPDAGAFPEVVEATGGGVIYDANDPGALARALEALILDPDRARALGEQGRENVFEKFGMEQTAEKMAALYEAIA